MQNIILGWKENTFKLGVASRGQHTNCVNVMGLKKYAQSEGDSANCRRPVKVRDVYIY